jgi:hypothetical protein
MISLPARLWAGLRLGPRGHYEANMFVGHYGPGFAIKAARLETPARCR